MGVMVSLFGLRLFFLQKCYVESTYVQCGVGLLRVDKKDSWESSRDVFDA